MTRSTLPTCSAIVKDTGIGHDLILRWVNHVDLFRIKGVQKRYAELLEASGVDSVPELAQRDPANLHPKMTSVNEKKSWSVSSPVRTKSPTGWHRPRNFPKPSLIEHET